MRAEDFLSGFQPKQKSAESFLQDFEPKRQDDRSFEVPTPANLARNRQDQTQTRRAPTESRTLGERTQYAAGQVFPMARTFTRKGTADLLGPTISALGTAGGTAVGGIPGAGFGFATAEELVRRLRGDAATAPKEYAEDVLFGSAAEKASRVAAPLAQKVAPYLSQKIGGLIEGFPFRFDFPKKQAERIARESFETPESRQAARKALQAAVARGDDLTAAQAMAAGGVEAPLTQATISKAAGKTQPTQQSIRELSQQAARQTTLREITPNLEMAIVARKTAAKPLYDQAFATRVPLNESLKSLFNRMPQGTLRDAANLARIEGRPFSIKDDFVTGENLHYIKRALNDVAYGRDSLKAIGRDQQLASRNLLNEYLSVVEDAIPSYGQARKLYAEMSAPINQAQVLKEMASVLSKPGGGEQVTQFLNVLGRGEEALLKRAGGLGGPRYEALSEVLTQEQLTTVKNIANQLKTNASVGRQIDAGSEALAAFIQEELFNFRLPNIFSVVATVANRVLESITKRVSKETYSKLAQAATTAKSFDELIAVLPLAERNKFLQVISDPKTWENISKVTAPAVTGLASEKGVLNAEQLGGVTNMNQMGF